MQLIDYAFNDTLGQHCGPCSGILAGQTTDAVPEPGTAALSLLAAGAVGLLTRNSAEAVVDSVRSVVPEDHMHSFGAMPESDIRTERTPHHPGNWRVYAAAATATLAMAANADASTGAVPEPGAVGLLAWRERRAGSSVQSF